MYKRVLPKLLTVGFLAAFGWFWYKNPTIFSPLKDISISTIVLIGVAKSAFHVGNGLFTKWTAEHFTPSKLTLGESYYVGVLTALGNFFGPILGGTSIRAVYLKKVHKLSYSKFTSTLIGYYLVLFTTTCIMALGALFVLPTTQQTNLLILFFGLWLVMMLAFSVIRLPAKNKLTFVASNKYIAKIVNIIYEIEDGWKLILRNRRLVLRLLMLALGIFVATVIITFLEFDAIGSSISLPGAIMFSVLTTVALLISFTPGAIGVRESILLVVGATMGVTNQQILQVAVIDRAITFGLLLVLFVTTRSKKLKRLFTSRDIQI